MAENLDAGNDGRLELLELSRERNFLQLTIDAVPDAEFVLEGF